MTMILLTVEDVETMSFDATMDAEAAEVVEPQ
jgi:hypothetical protein